MISRCNIVFIGDLINMTGYFCVFINMRRLFKISYFANVKEVDAKENYVFISLIVLTPRSIVASSVN